jgi:CRP-like cAMP-binding protein
MAHISDNVLIRKLGNFTRFSDEERVELDRLTRASTRRIDAGDDLVREGDSPDRVNLILEGWAFRYNDLEDGRRQITAVMLPGDICDLGMSALTRMDHSIGAASALTVAEMSIDQVEQVRRRFRRIDLALQWNAVVEAAIAREWTTNIGRRSASERLAHLFCEILFRLKAVGLIDEKSLDFPLTQQQMGDATGLSTVHINRSLMTLRAANLIILKERSLTIPNLARLRDLALFRDWYLHLEHEGAQFDAE